MPRGKGSSQTAEPDGSRRGRRIAAGVVVLLAVLALLFFGRAMLAWWARQAAARQMRAGAISAAQQRLAWSARLDPGSGKTDLMQAACFRHLGRQDRWKDALQSAERKGAPAARVQQELKLGMIRWGELHEGAEHEVGALLEAGVSPHEAAAALVYGLLARGEPERADEVLDAWAADCPEEADVAFMRGVYRRWLGEHAPARSEFENALARQPRHELARTGLAELFEEQHQLDRALGHYVELATRSCPSEVATVGLARVLRKLGRIAEARAVLEALASQPGAPPGAAVEMGQIEFESGNYEEAERWFEQADLDQAHYDETLRGAASMFALEGNVTRAEGLFARVDAARHRSLRLDELRVRLATDPNDRLAASELQRLSTPSVTIPPDAIVPGGGQAGKDRRENPGTSALELYALHCGACHGTNGDGNGRAARHLFPRPRDFRTESFRLVSTRNGVPTLKDVETFIRQGMSGTAMRSFENLSEDQRKLLAEEVLRLNREGVRERFIHALTDEGEEIDESEVRQVVELCTTPGEIVPVPEIGPPGPEAIAKGRDAYVRLGCDNCHGDDGTGTWDTPLFDEKGRPSPPRDLVYEPFKGGHEPESVYLRVYVGMPGTPHPACCNVPEDQLVDLVHFCLWLSREPKRGLTNHERATEAANHAYLSAFGGSAAPRQPPAGVDQADQRDAQTGSSPVGLPADRGPRTNELNKS